MSEIELTAQERLVLVALLAVSRTVTNAELRETAGVELTGEARRRLNEYKLVTSERLGRAFVHQLTEAGAVRGEKELLAARPDRAGRYGGVLYAVLGAVGRHLRRADLTLAEVFRPDVEMLVRRAYDRLAPALSSPVRLSALRRELDGAVSSRDIDAELRRMAELPGVHLRAVVNQQTLTDEDRAAAVRLGSEDRYNHI